MPDSDPADVVLDGALTVRTAAIVRDRLLAALAEHALVRVDCSAAESIDLSVLQLLLAARRSAAAAGKHVGLTAPAAGTLRGALEQAGLLPAAGADPFWTDEA
jgi:ABC-type transporter Mla MlaB component